MSLDLDVKEYLAKKGISHKEVQSERGGEFNIRQCPICGDSGNHTFINRQTGVFYCHKCGEGGSFLTFKEKLGDVAKAQTFSDYAPREEAQADVMDIVEAAHTTLLRSKEGMQYAASRGFTMDAIRKLKLGFSIEDGNSYLWFPYLKGDRALNVKKRRIDKKEFKRITGMPSILYNVDATATRTEYIIICEGESDVVAMVSNGFVQVVGATIGAKGIANEWIQQLDKFPKIIIAYDRDAEGQEGSYRLANRLGLERCYRLRLPRSINDLNQFFIDGGDIGAMAKLIEGAKKFDVEHVSSLGDEIKNGILRKERNDPTEERLHFPWAKLDYLTDGLVGGDLVVLASKPGVGKTTMALNILYQLSIKNIPVLLFELEMRPERIMPRVVAMHLGVDSKHVLGSDSLPQAYKELSPVPFYFAYLYKKPTFDQVADTIRQCIRSYGIKMVVFDNIHFLCRSTSDQTREVSVVIQSFKLLAEELAIPIIAIARPRKNTGKIIANIDLKDSADIEGDADIIILLHRETKVGTKGDYVETEGIFEEQMLTRVSKCRFSPGGDLYLKMQDKLARVIDM